MPVGTQKDYYAVLGVDRQARPDQIRKAYRRLARKSEVSIDFSPVCNGVKRDQLGSVICPQKDSVVPNTVLVEARQVSRRVSEGLGD